MVVVALLMSVLRVNDPFGKRITNFIALLTFEYFTDLESSMIILSAIYGEGSFWNILYNCCSDVENADAAENSVQ